MKRNIEISEENEENEEQKLSFESEVLTQQNTFLDIFDTNIISQIFVKLTIPIISEEQEEEEEYKDYKCCFLNCASFSLISKIFNSISKQSKFSIPIFELEKIENIDFNIYLKLNYILQQERITNRIYTKEDLLNNILFYVSENGIYNLIPILILNGASVETDDYGLTPLCSSCSEGNYKTSKILVENNSNINFKDGRNNTSILHKASKSGNLKLVKYLIKLGLNIDETNNIGQTPIFHACESGNLELVKYLIKEKKIDFNIEDIWGSTILFEAVESKNIELINYLLSLGLDIDHRDNDGQTVLYYSYVSNEDLELAKYLIGKGADLTIRYDNQNQNILEVMKSENPNST